MRHMMAACAATAFSLAALTSAGAQQPLGDVESVLSAASAALGAQNLSKLPSAKETGTGTFAGLPVSVTVYTDLAGGGKFAQYARFVNQLLSTDQGFDGTSAWTRDAKGVVWVDGTEQVHAGSINEAFRESYALWTSSHGKAAVALTGTHAQDGRTYDIVRVTPPGSVAPFDVWIDRATHLPARYVETLAAVTTTTTLSDFRPVAGVQLAFTVHSVTSQGNPSELHLTRVEVAPSDLAARVGKPQTDVHDFSIAGGGETTVPFELIDNHVYLDVLLNGKGPYRFMFDTGGQNVIDPAVAREVGAISSGIVQGAGVGAGTEDVSFAPLRSLRFGNAELRDQVFAVIPIRAGFGVAASATADGLIGAEVLARFVTVFDYASNKLTFKLPGAPPAGSSVPFVFAGSQPQVPCALDGIATQCTIDTGSRSSLDLHAPFIAANPSVMPANAAAPGVNGFGVGGADIGRVGRLGSIEFGGFDLKDQIAGFSLANSGAFAVPGIGANLGGGLLKRFNITFDYMHQIMSLVPNANYNAPDEFDRSGIFVINQNKIVIAAVRPGTPAADAGLAKGDVIQSIDALQGSRLTLGAARSAFRGASGSKLQLSILSKGATVPRAVTLTLRDYV
jgi:hypothetical protein